MAANEGPAAVNPPSRAMFPQLTDGAGGDIPPFDRPHSYFWYLQVFFPNAFKRTV